MTRRKGTQDETASVSITRGTDWTAPDAYVLRIISEAGVTNVMLPARGAVVIGRGEDADVRIDHASISRRHARLVLDRTVSVSDLGSRNGVSVGGRALAGGEVHELRPGDMLTLGRVLLVVEPHGPSARADDASGGRVLGSSPAMQEAERVLDRIAVGEINVLLLGETGVGKEVMAERVHRSSRRAGKPFLRLNCGALSETLVESELFGHERGAFTGAQHPKPGLLEVADGGTVFLDEVGELPIATQVKLLRVIEERSVLRVGGTSSRNIDVRFVAATNRDLEEMIAHGGFRADLYYRLNGYALVIPPLRERTDEIEPLTALFIQRASRSAGRAMPPVLAKASLDALLAYPWPGNVRELRNVIERAVLLADAVIEPSHLPLAKRQVDARGDVQGPATPSLPESRGDSLDLKRDVDELERRRILEALERCGGNQTRAAKLLNISRTTLVMRLRDYGVRRPRS